MQHPHWSSPVCQPVCSKWWGIAFVLLPQHRLVFSSVRPSHIRKETFTVKNLHCWRLSQMLGAMLIAPSRSILIPKARSYLDLFSLTCLLPNSLFSSILFPSEIWKIQIWKPLVLRMHVMAALWLWIVASLALCPQLWLGLMRKRLSGYGRIQCCSGSDAHWKSRGSSLLRVWCK